MPIEVAAALRLRGTIERALAETMEGPSPSSAPGLVETYSRVRVVALELVKGTEAETEFDSLYPELPEFPDGMVANAQRAATVAERAKLLLGGLAGWLASWPDAEQLLDELIAALEQAEAQATEPEEKERLAGLLEGLKGAGRQIAVGVVTAYLTRVHM